MAVVCAGVFAVGYSRDRTRALILGGLTTGLGVASMHYLGMAAVRLHGDVRYDPLLVALSVLIAVVAATAALWAGLNIKSPVAVTVASLVMGAAVSSMHYTGMFAVSVRVTPSGSLLPGATAMQFIFPLAVGLGSFLFLTSAFVDLRAAVERAELAGGISGVFVNLARRSQILVHRQLNLLDSMERRSEDPDELSDLFRLDHLTTRMRRHAESLIILSGASPGRAWRMPVSLTSVVRAAVSEIEDYARVEVRPLPATFVVGAAVADLTHLLAEIVENAAQFSPPHTRVRIVGEPVGNGYVLEVEDRGPGMGQDALAEANRRIQQSEALDLLDSDRFGLFVVSRLAARHGIKVHLRTSPYGGTTAVVLMPTTLLDSAVPERSDKSAAETQPPPERDSARVPGSALPQEAVAAPAARPALVATAMTSPEPPSHTTPPGVTTLRPYFSPDASEGSDDLPRRVRQANLAPQLRERRTEAPVRAVPSRDADRRTPELVRDRMAAYREGWARGGGRHPGRGTAPDPAAGRDSSEGDPA
ncbi:MHYT domain-containing protein [Streptomyces sp. NPDC001978]|uniref:MHYT domain-containing protein n=1 Tax=Streptomyces sp. NPDC001978 TaxID=3364627 RepID=UPI0036ACD4ED